MFIDNLKRILELKKISFYKLCKETEMPQSTKTKWENGAQPTLEKIERIAKYLDVSTDLLIFGNDKTIENIYTTEENEIIICYRKANETDKSIVKLTLEKYKSMEKSLTSENIS